MNIMAENKTPQVKGGSPGGFKGGEERMLIC